jgi:drug/metabolite transporter (DMT)-like permease
MRLWLMVALTMMAFAANSLLNRAALAEGAIGPALFAAVRLGSGALALAVLVTSRGGHLQITRGRLADAAALAVYMLGFSFAYLWLDAGIGALILFGTVQVTMFGGALARREAPTPRRWIGAGVAFAGLVWLLWPAGSKPTPAAGAVLMLAAGVGWAVYSLRGRGVRDPTAVTAANFLVATPVALGVLLIAPAAPATPAGVGLAIVSGVVTSGLGYALWYAVLPRLQASAAAVAQLTVPAIALMGGTLLLGETPSLRTLLAATLVFSGVAWSLTPARGR